MNILLWHVHGSWTTAFVQGKHRYLVPVNAARDAWGRGRARTYPWPDSVEEVGPESFGEADVVILQRPEELDLAPPGIPRIYVEHNTPKGDVPDSRHPMADRDDLVIVHVTHFNDLFWDAGGTPGGASSSSSGRCRITTSASPNASPPTSSTVSGQSNVRARPRPHASRAALTGTR